MTNSALDPVETWLVHRGAEGSALMFRNNRRTSIRISSIQLLNCQNTRPGCVRLDPRLTLEPGQVSEGLNVRPDIPGQGFSFHYTFTWVSVVEPAAETARPLPEAVRLDAGVLTPEAARALGSRFTGIRAAADSIVLQVGQYLSVQDVPVFAVDSSGTRLGRLTVFDAGMASGAASLTGPGRLIGVMAGVSQLTLRLPASYWPDAGRPRPSAQVRIIVR